MKIKEIERKITENWKAISGVVPGDITPSRLVRIAVNSLKAKPDLQNCSTESIVTAIVQAAQVGIEPDDATNRANLIRRKSTCYFELQYRGILDLAYRSGTIASAKAQVVYEHDEYDVDLGTRNSIKHVPLLGQERGRIVGAYAIVYLRGSKIPLIEVVDERDIGKFRKAGSSSSPSWRDWPEEMVKKSALKRCMKSAPCSAEFRAAMTLDDAVTVGKGIRVEDVFPDFDPAKADAAWSSPQEDEPVEGTDGQEENA